MYSYTQHSLHMLRTRTCHVLVPTWATRSTVSEINQSEIFVVLFTTSRDNVSIHASVTSVNVSKQSRKCLNKSDQHTMKALLEVECTGQITEIQFLFKSIMLLDLITSFGRQVRGNTIVVAMYHDQC